MAVLKLFCSTRNYLVAMGFYAPLQSNQNSKINGRNCFYVFSQMGMIVVVTAYMLIKATSASEYSVCFYISSAMTNLVFYCVVMIYKMESILKFIEQNEQFIENRVEYKSITTLKYMEMNEKIELISKWTYFIMAKLTLAGVVLPLLILSLFNYLILDLDDESFILPWPMLLPFDWKTPIGYAVSIIAEGASAHAALFCAVPIVTIFVGSACLIICFLDDITNELADLNGNAIMNENHIEIKKRFCYIFRIYSDAKQFIVKFNKIYEFVIATLFLFSLLSLAISLLVFLWQSSQENSNPVEMIFTLIMICTSFVPIFWFCEFGEMITNQLNTFDEKLWQCNWYAFPLDIQKLMLTFISWTQRSMVFCGYGNIECTRDSFKKMVKRGFSFFMPLRKIAE